MSRVSVVIASYNYGRYIGECLRSLQAQTFTDWDALVVDDGSTDDSKDVIRSFLGDGRIRHMENLHLGQPRTKNAGIRATSAPLVAFLDADDRWHPEKLAKQVPMFANERLGVCGTGRYLIDPDGRITGRGTMTFPQGDVTAELFRDNFICFSSSVVRRSAIDQCGLFDESLQLAIDYDWWLRISRHWHFAVLPEPLVEYRTGHANLSKRVAERLDTALAIMDRNVQYVDAATSRRAYAETLRHRGLVARRAQPLAALGWIVKSLARQPMDLLTWRALATGCLPAGVRRMLRRGPDWEAA